MGSHNFRRLSLTVHPSQPKLVMAQPEKEKAMTTDIVQQIRKATRRRFTAEEKIRIVLANQKLKKSMGL